MRHWLKTVVVSDTEKAHVMRQVGTGKTAAAETSKWFQMTSKPVICSELSGQRICD
jgi:hypothetical protein